jgi:hypothetical protein
MITYSPIVIAPSLSLILRSASGGICELESAIMNGEKVYLNDEFEKT